MNEAVIHVHRGGPLVALVGNPNCGKTALFNLLTGSRQKVANYAGVTVERKEGRLARPPARRCACSTCLAPTACIRARRTSASPRRAARAQPPARSAPTSCVCVVDATNLRRNLRLVLAVQAPRAAVRRRAEHGRPRRRSAASRRCRCAGARARRAGGAHRRRRRPAAPTRCARCSTTPRAGASAAPSQSGTRRRRPAGATTTRCAASCSGSASTTLVAAHRERPHRSRRAASGHRAAAAGGRCCS